MKHNIKAYACASLSLLGLPFLLSVAQKSDFELLLSNNPELSKIDVQQLSIRESDCHKTTEFKRDCLRKKTIVSLVWVLSALAIADATLYPRLNITTISAQQFFSIASVVAFSWGTLGRLGWADISFHNSTIYERLDTFMFWALYWIGTLFGILAVVNGSSLPIINYRSK